MKRFIESQKPLIDRYGLLPGVTLAFAIVLCGMLALTTESWLAVGLVMVLLVSATIGVVWVIAQVTEDDEHPRTH